MRARTMRPTPKSEKVNRIEIWVHPVEDSGVEYEDESDAVGGEEEHEEAQDS